MKYEKIFKEKFNSIINEYHLKYVDILNDTIALIGRKYALVVTIHLDNMYVQYVFRNEENNYIGYNVSSYFVSKFDSDDRRGIDAPNNVEETLVAIFNIWSRGLPRHWSNMLKGDLAWLQDYEKFELAVEPKLVDSSVSSKLDNLI